MTDLEYNNPCGGCRDYKEDSDMPNQKQLMWLAVGVLLGVFVWPRVAGLIGGSGH